MYDRSITGCSFEEPAFQSAGLWNSPVGSGRIAYLYDGRLEIDNNLMENAIRPIALGRKNYLFAGSQDAAQNIAMYRSFFATCRLNHINPYDWTRIRTQYY